MFELGQRKQTFLFYETSFGAHSASYSMDTGVIFSGVKRPKRESHHSPPYNADVKNQWSYTSILFLCLHGVAGTTLQFEITDDQANAEIEAQICTYWAEIVAFCLSSLHTDNPYYSSSGEI